MRRTFGSELINAGEPLAKALGHSNPATTAKYYSVVSENAVRAALAIARQLSTCYPVFLGIAEECGFAARFVQLRAPEDHRLFTALSSDRSKSLA